MNSIEKEMKARFDGLTAKIINLRELLYGDDDMCDVDYFKPSIPNGIWDNLWFNNSDVTLTVENIAIQTKIKGLCMNAMKGNRKDLLHDPIVSNLLNPLEPHHSVYVLYITRTKLKSLIAIINKKCGVSIDPDITVLKLYIDSDVYVLSKGRPSYIQHKYDNAIRENFFEAQWSSSVMADFNLQVLRLIADEIYD